MQNCLLSYIIHHKGIMVGRFLGSRRGWPRCSETLLTRTRILLLGVCLCMAVIQPVAGQNTESSEFKCEKAINMTLWAFDEAQKPAVDELLGEAAVEYAAQQPLTTDLIPIMPQLSWAAFQVQAVITKTDNTDDVVADHWNPIVAGYWNSYNSGLTVTVPIENNINLFCIY